MWKKFNSKFDDKNAAFENLCKEFLNIKLDDNPLTPFNKMGSETEPYHGKISFQSKFCETASLVNKKKKEIIKGILHEKAINKDLEVFYVFVYPQFTDNPRAKDEITKEAQNIGVDCKFYDKDSLLFEIEGNLNYSRLVSKYFQNEKDWSTTHSQSNFDIPFDYIERRLLLNNEKDKTNREVNIDELIKMDCNILIINHAGYGKTVYLRKIFNRYNTSSDFGTAYLSLKNYKNNSLINSLNLITDPKAYIFLDGYDEIDSNLMSEFKNEISNIMEIHTNWRFIITSRYKPSLTEGDFKLCELLPFEDEDINKYLNKNTIEVERFLTGSKINKIDMFLYNSFYLSQIVSFYKNNNFLPVKNNLLYQLFGNQFAKDKEKIESTNIELLMKKMSKIAFDIVVGNIDKISIIDNDKNFGWMYYDSNEEKLDFIHNNFKEYLAAVYLDTLPKNEIIKLTSIVFDEYVVVIPKFKNVLAHLFDISKNEDIKNFIREKALYLILRSDYLLENDEKTIELIKTIFGEVKDRKSWISNNYDRNLISKICNKECVEYLISLLDFANHRTVIIESLNVLKNANIQYLNECNLKTRLLDILNNKEKCGKDSYLIDTLIRTLCIFDLSKDEIKVIVDNYYLFNSSIRTAIYDLILSTNNCDNFVDLLIKGIKLNRVHATFKGSEGEEDNIYNISEGRYLYNCIEALRNENSLISLLKVLEDNIKKHSSLEEKFENSLFIALSNSNITDDIKNKLFDVYIQKYKHYNQFSYKNVYTFLEKKKLIMPLFDYILNSELNKDQQIWAISSFANQEILIELIGIFRIDKDYFECYYHLESLLDDEYKRNDWLHEIVEKHKFILPPKIDRKGIINNKIQEVFNLLFDINKMKEYCESEIKKFKSAGVDFIDYYYKANQPPLIKSIYHFNENLDVNKLNWKNFQIEKIYDYLNSYSFLCVDAKKREFIKQWIIDNYSSIKFEDNIKINGNGYTFTYNGMYANYFIKNLDLEFDELVYSDMLYYDVLLCSEEKLNYVKNKISEELFKKTCLNIISDRLIEGSFTYNFMIDYSLDNKWYEIFELLINRLDSIDNFSNVEYAEKINLLKFIELYEGGLLCRFWCKFDAETKLLYFNNLPNIIGEKQKLLICEINNDKDNAEKFIELGILNSIDFAKTKCIEIIKKEGFDKFNVEIFGKLRNYEDYKFLVEILKYSYYFETNSFRDLKTLIFESIELIINEQLKNNDVDRIAEILFEIHKFIKESKFPDVGYLHYYVDRILNNISWHFEKR